jgi:hypothetical protein
MVTTPIKVVSTIRRRAAPKRVRVAVASNIASKAAAVVKAAIGPGGTG